MNNGRYGEYGGQYISETLMNELLYLEEQYNHYMNDPDFVEELNTLLIEYAGRPSLLYYAERMTNDLGGAKIYLKREDLNHTGAHKINNVLGQVLLAKKWERQGSLPKPVPASMEWLLQLPQLCLIWNVKCLWERWTLKGRH